MNTFTIPLAPDRFDAARQKLLAEGYNIAGDQGDIVSTEYHVTLGYDYNGADTLTITVKQKPFALPEYVLEQKVRTWFA